MELGSYPAIAGRRLVRSRRIQILPSLPFFYVIEFIDVFFSKGGVAQPVRASES